MYASKFPSTSTSALSILNSFLTSSQFSFLNPLPPYSATRAPAPVFKPKEAIAVPLALAEIVSPGVMTNSKPKFPNPGRPIPLGESGTLMSSGVLICSHPVMISAFSFTNSCSIPGVTLIPKLTPEVLLPPLAQASTAILPFNLHSLQYKPI
ncbi:hypothetical protein AA313_de0204909 [Arthrobotrys entomopaga]|nr:hypothetical protein AA313_de0204909 [Arthrobotrys entomopaga]